MMCNLFFILVGGEHLKLASVGHPQIWRSSIDSDQME